MKTENPDIIGMPAFTALVLAGDRGPDDPVAQATGAGCKALSPVGGTPMLLRVLDALSQSEEIGTTVLSGPPRAQLEQNRPLRDGVAQGRWAWRAPGATPSTSAFQSLRSLGDDTPVLLTTAV